MQYRAFLRLISAAALLVLASRAVAGTASEPVQQADTAVTATDQKVARFVDDQVIAVVRVDIEAFDPKAIGDWSATFLQKAGLPQDQNEQLLSYVRGRMTALQNWKTGFRKAGGRTIYFVVNTRVLFDLPYVLAPLENGGDADALIAQMQAAELLKVSGWKDPPQPANAQEAQELKKAMHDLQVNTAKLDDVVVMATNKKLEELRKPNRQVTRNDSLAALAAQGQIPIAISIGASDSVRKQFTDAFKDSPDNAEPEEIKAFKNWQWASIGVSLPPQPALNAILKTASPEAAKSAADLATKLITDAKQQKEGWLGSLSNRDQLLGMLTPKTDGDELRLSLNQSQIEQILVTALKSNLTTQPTTSPSN